MQKTTLPVFILTCFTVLSADAQINKGATLLGGQISFSTSKTEQTNVAPTKNSSFSFSPAFGKAVKENLVLGVDLLYNHSMYKSNDQKERDNSYGLGFFVRRYKVLGKGFYLFGQGRLGGYYQKNEYDSPQPGVDPAKAYGVQLAFSPGVAYSVSRKLQLEAGFNNLAVLQFDHKKTSYYTTDYTTDNFAVTSSLSTGNAGITLGLRVLLN